MCDMDINAIWTALVRSEDGLRVTTENFEEPTSRENAAAWFEYEMAGYGCTLLEII